MGRRYVEGLSRTKPINKNRSRGFIDRKGRKIEQGQFDDIYQENEEGDESDLISLPRRKNKFSLEFKKKVCEYAKKHSVNAAAKKFDVYKKNVERWMSGGYTRKKGAGRKITNPTLETELVSWMEESIAREGKMPKRKLIIGKARDSAAAGFKASKGWCDKFLKRNKERFEGLLK